MTGISGHLEFQKIHANQLSILRDKALSSLDFTGVERHSEADYDCENIAFGDIESY
jgi:hypothetical protein